MRSQDCIWPYLLDLFSHPVVNIQEAFQATVNIELEVWNRTKPGFRGKGIHVVQDVDHHHEVIAGLRSVFNIPNLECLPHKRFDDLQGLLPNELLGLLLYLSVLIGIPARSLVLELNGLVLHEKLPQGQKLVRHHGYPLEEVLRGGVLEPFEHILAKDLSGDIFSWQIKVVIPTHHKFLAIIFFRLGQFWLWDEFLDFFDLRSTLWFGYQEGQVNNRAN